MSRQSDDRSPTRHAALYGSNDAPLDDKAAKESIPLPPGSTTVKSKPIPAPKPKTPTFRAPRVDDRE